MKQSIRLFVAILCLGTIMVSCQSKQLSKDEVVEFKIDSLLQQMTLAEKINMVHASSSFNSGGVERLGIPELVMSDGPHGVRVEHGRDWEVDTDVDDAATYLPKGLTLAATWNRKLGYEFGNVLGSEANYRGKDVILGPGICIVRTPLNGRNFEYLSEDPYLAGQMAVGYIQGVQANGIAACVKHFVANNQETWRYSVDVSMSERALREIYLPGFEMAVKEGKALTLMGAYNQFRGEHCSHNDYLLNKILKDEWGFDGVVISDWNAVHDTKQALLNGTDIEMGTDLSMKPNIDYNKFYLADPALEMIKSGEVEEKYLDDKVRRILRLMYRINKFDKRPAGEFNTAAHQQTALKIAEEGIVLLKNESILPIDATKVKTIAVIGDNAIRQHQMGGGSSQVKAKYEVTFLEGIQQVFGDAVKIEFAPGYEVSKTNQVNTKLVSEAKKLASKADVVIFVGGWIQSWSTDYTKSDWSENVFDAEDVDKPNMILPFSQNELIAQLAAVNPNTMVVLYGGGPVEMGGWLPQVKGLVQAWYPGMEGGNALANIISGKVNPSGKLPITFPKLLSESPAHVFGEYPGVDEKQTYNDDIWVGYRYFDTYKVKPEFCFGFGLSYTQFEYDNLRVSQDGQLVKVAFEVRNSGKVAGSEVAQVYINDPESRLKRPEKELKGFDKVYLEPGQTQNIEVVLDQKAFRYFDDEKMEWVLEPGTFNIEVGSSSKSILLKQAIEM
ncbi:MAG: beta-glucosidase [Prolixibacteraceae bacterium]